MLMVILAMLLQPPAPQPAATIDGKIEAIAKLRAQQADLKKQELVAVEELKKLLDELKKKLDELNLNGPAPMPPNPGPGPVPPLPPNPADPLAVALKAAFQAERDRQKGEALKELTELYRQAAIMAADPAVRSTSELLTRIRQAMNVLPLLKGEALMGMRRLIAAECSKLGEPTTDPMTDATRAQAVALFQKIHAALVEVKP